jgi:hypothetical protein
MHAHGRPSRLHASCVCACPCVYACECVCVRVRVRVRVCVRLCANTCGAMQVLQDVEEVFAASDYGRHGRWATWAAHSNAEALAPTQGRRRTQHDEEGPSLDPPSVTGQKDGDGLIAPAARVHAGAEEDDVDPQERSRIFVAAAHMRRLSATEQAARLGWASRTTPAGRPVHGWVRHVAMRFVRGDSVILVQPAPLAAATATATA